MFAFFRENGSHEEGFVHHPTTQKERKNPLGGGMGFKGVFLFVLVVVLGCSLCLGEKQRQKKHGGGKGWGRLKENQRKSQEIPVSTSNHTSNWAIIVDTSRWWYNYRHSANALAMYHTVKRLGIPDSNIILMLAEEVGCNPRNIFPGTVYHRPSVRQTNLYGPGVEVDYRDYEVTVESLIRLLVDRHSPLTPRSKRLLSDSGSNILIYMTGHGGVDFIKFQDAEDIQSHDLADAFSQMWIQKRYNEILFVVDTCQAATLYSAFDAPNIIAVGSSLEGENSYSQTTDEEIGVSLSDRFTDYSLVFFEKLTPDSNHSLGQWLDTLSYNKLHSHVGAQAPMFERAPLPSTTNRDASPSLSSRQSPFFPLHSVRVTDFFGARSKVFPLDSLSISPPPPSSNSPPSFASPNILDDDELGLEDEVEEIGVFEGHENGYLSKREEIYEERRWEIENNEEARREIVKEKGSLGEKEETKNRTELLVGWGIFSVSVVALLNFLER